VTTFKDPTSFVIAKVSVPGLVRHEILLSPDHWELELLLIQKIFIPGHKKTYTDVDRDPEPKHSLFSFHTIANIFFGVYDSLRDDPSLPSAQKVGDADVDNVFFAAIDNWRVGIEMNREGYKAVRGIQEFCDVGLEIAFWIKEHGLPKGANKRKRTGGGDKGDKKGPGRPPKVNRLQAKSKVKSSASEKGMKKNMVAKVKGGKVEKKRK
jgi:hypothetical protein